MPASCEGKVAVVTGASRGIGAAIAKRLAGQGARLALAARSIEPDPRYGGSLLATAREIRCAGGEAIVVRTDLSKAEDRAELITETERQLAPVDILGNNAAVTFVALIEELTRKRFDLMVEVQLWAPYELAQLVVPGMKAKGQGWILNISSRVAEMAPGPPFDVVQTKGFAMYGMVKAGLDRMTNSLAAELYEHGITVNALAPWDHVATPGAQAHDLVDGFPLEDIALMAAAALALCTATPDEVTGRITCSRPLLDELGRWPSGVERI